MPARVGPPIDRVEILTLPTPSLLTADQRSTVKHLLHFAWIETVFADDLVEKLLSPYDLFESQRGVPNCRVLCPSGSWRS